MNATDKKQLKVKSKQLLSKIKQIIKEGNARIIMIKNPNGKTLLKIPVTAGVAGVVLLPFYAAIAALTAMAVDYTIEIEKKK